MTTESAYDFPVTVRQGPITKQLPQATIRYKREEGVAQERIHALADRAAQGDREAFGELYRHYYAVVYIYVLSRCKNEQLAEDITSETFLRMLKHIHTFAWRKGGFGGCLYTVARNLLTDHFKSSHHRFTCLVGEFVESERTVIFADFADTVVEHALYPTLYQAIEFYLTPTQRDIIIHRFFLEDSSRTTGEAVGKSNTAVKALQRRATRRLAATVGPSLRG